MLSTKTRKLIIPIVILAAVLRLWKLPERTVFSGEANNVLNAMTDMLSGKRSIFQGQRAASYVEILSSTPWYIYLMLPVLTAANRNPIAVMYFQPLLSLIGIYFLFRAGEIWHSTKAGLFAAFIYTVLMPLINLDRSVWSVGLLPFSVNLILFTLAKAAISPSKINYLMLGFAMGFSLSLHFSSIISCLIALIFIATCKNRNGYIKWLILPIILSFLPLILYDLNHNFANSRGLFLVAKSFLDKTRPYGSGYFAFQFYPPIVLLAGITLASIPKLIGLLIVLMLFTSQIKLFIDYRAIPNYPQRYKLIEELLSFWKEPGMKVFFNDKSSFEYTYLMRYLSNKKGIDYRSILTLEPKWEYFGGQKIVEIRQMAIDFKPDQKNQVENFIRQNKAILMIDQEKIKLLPIID